MKIPVASLLPAAVLVGLGVYAATTLTATRAHATPSTHAETTANRQAPTTPGLPAPPSAHAPLLQREAWIMQWQPAWVQSAWKKAGRPPLYWGQMIGPSGMWGYFFTQNQAAGQSSNVTLPNYAPLRVMRTDPPSWYGWPLSP